ncbi:MAG: DUF1365 domain-containing protein [Micavibrio aeruginosavorus]|uniref:DUF1365 domain-containing protein n=1 Tax=Micavibrio aeruginosavorus TaxID=349221 RepID=A0A2W5BP94_9BACT|nr:MAG: DUF1365 domain-containing protein [Micavibrio aeruginosavorus]
MAGNVMHGRLFPKKNHFRYGIYYLALPLSRMGQIPIAYNRPGFMSFYDRDHGYGTKGTLESWARSILEGHNIHLDGEIVLICMPRIFGYVFNPVSFWLCHDKAGELKAVLCEVHNTFGEKHTYLCAHRDGRVITPNEIMTAEKVFHVSPFLAREGRYEFRFDSTHEQFKVWIDYYDAAGDKQLITALAGNYEAMTKNSCRRMFWQYPLVTLKAIALIHYQALLIVIKGIRYIPKPLQRKPHVSITENLTKI